jgi:hypothetical protein
MTRTYDLDLVDSNDRTIAMWSKVTGEQLAVVYSTIALMPGYFFNLSINRDYRGDNDPGDTGRCPSS